MPSHRQIANLRRAITRPNGRKAIERLRDDLYTLIARAPATEREKSIATTVVSGALTTVEFLFAPK